MKKNVVPLIFLSSLLCVVIPLLFSGCSEEQKSIKVGYIGCLSGKCSSLGTAGRDGVIFAAEQINGNGGIVYRESPGTKIEVAAVDTRGQKDVAEKAFMALVDKGVAAVIGPMTSQMGIYLKPLSDTSKTVLLSPTVSTTRLSKIDDYFFRIMTTADTAAPVLANYAVNVDKRHSFVIAYDETNKAFTDTWIDIFSESVKEFGGKIIGLQPLSNTLPLIAYAERINDLKPDGLLIVADSFSSGLLIQQLNKLGSPIQVMGTEWSTTGDLVENSGRALENAYFITSYDPNGREDRHIEFVSNYQKRFNTKPSFPAKFGYEAMVLLSSAISNSSEASSLKNSLIKLGPIQGLQDSLEIDRYGDIQRHVYVMKFKDNEFEVVAKGDGNSFMLMSPEKSF